MLVPFEINEQKIKELNIPRHVADWHRVRILKEIDDIRYQAMTYANIDLTGESMLALKKQKLFGLFNPVIEYTRKDGIVIQSSNRPSREGTTEYTNLKIKSYDNIVEAYDIPIDWYFKTLMDMFDFFKLNKLRVSPDRLLFYLKNDALKVVTNFWGKDFFFFFLETDLPYNGYYLSGEKLEAWYAQYKDTFFSAFNFMEYSGNYNFNSEIWRYKEDIQRDRTCLYLIANYHSEQLMYDYGRAISNVPKISIYHFKYFFNYKGYKDDDQFGTLFYPNRHVTSDYYFFDPDRKINRLDENGNAVRDANGNYVYIETPELLKLESVLAYIATQVMHFAPLSDTTDVLKASLVKSVVDRNTPVVLEEPFYNAYSTTASPEKIDLASYNSERYTILLGSGTTAHSFLQYYKSQNVTLENGKTYFLPFEPYKYKNPFGTDYLYSYQTYSKANPCLGINRFSDIIYQDEEYLTKMTNLSFSNNIIDDIKPNKKFFYDKNVPQFSFPSYFPRMLLFNKNRIRNGILYADASKFYQLEFIKYPDTTLSKIDSLILQQESIQELYTDIQKKFYFFEKTYDAVLKKTIFNWFYLDNGVKMPFLHPVTLKPVSGIKFLYEMIFEMVVLWGQIQKEISTFLEQRKVQNENAFNIAYQNYLRGQATIKGPEALALFEEKLRTGVFYIENGLEYWRKFSELEIQLIEKFKSDAYKNAEIEKQNIEIKKLNEQYQLEANRPILMANEKILSEARAIVLPEMKKIADAELSKIVPPTIDYLLARAESEGGFPTDILNKWVQENPNYYIRPDVRAIVEKLLAELTLKEQQVATALAAEAVAEVKFTKALQEIFEFKG